MSTLTPKQNFRFWEPGAIITKSFQIIEEELKGQVFPPNEFPIIRRVIHATADFDFAHLLCFHPRAVSAGVEALQAGSTIVIDVRMVEVGINQALVRDLRGKTLCLVHDTEVAQMAEALGETRSAVAMRRAAEREKGIFVIGSAPTALFTLLRLVGEGKVSPFLIVGVPVGFVGAAEAKEALMALESVPWIVSVGCKGGSAVAVAIVNALLLRAAGQDG